MSAEHDYFVALISPWNLSDGVIRSFAFRIIVVDDIEFQFNWNLIAKQTIYPAKVFIAHYDRRHDLGDIESPIVEGSYLAVLPTCIVDSNERAVRKQKGIGLFRHLDGRQLAWLWGLLLLLLFWSPIKR